MRDRLLALLLLATALSCSDGSGPGGSGPGAALLAPPRPGEGMQLAMSGFEVPANGEAEFCQLVVLDNEEPLAIGGFEIRQPLGSHHFVVYAYQGEDADEYPAGLFSAGGCIGVGPKDSMNLVQVAGAGNEHARIDYPAGTGVILRPHQPLLLNSHYANPSAEPLRPTVYTNLLFARGGVRHGIESAAISNYNISLPPGTTRKTTARWTVPFDLFMIVLSSHEHKRGKLFTARVVEGSIDRPEGDLVGTNYGEDEPPSGSTPEPGDFYRSDDWEHPTTLTYEEPRLFRKGTVIEFSCTHENDKRVPLAFGPLADDEMCFVTGLYYRADGAPPPGTPVAGCLRQDAQLTCSADPVSGADDRPVVCGDGRKARSEECDLGDGNGPGAACGEACRLALGAGAVLGTREFAPVFAGPGAGATDFLNSITGSSSVDAAIGPRIDGALRLTAGAIDADGNAAVSQDATATIGIPVLGGSGSFCIRFLPTAAAGAVHCRGGAAGIGIGATIDNADLAAQPTGVQVALGGGGDGGPGGALLLLDASLLQIPGSPDECVSRDWSADEIVPLPFTTGNAIGTITSANGVPGATLVLARDGENFDCARWADPTGPGILQAMPFLSPNTPAIGDVIAQLVVSGHEPPGDDGPRPTPVPTPAPTEIGGEAAAIVEEILVPSCALPSCHSQATRAGALVLERDFAWDEIVGQGALNGAARSAGLLRVTPGDAEASFLVRKLEGRLGAGMGARMPLGGAALPADAIERIRVWIVAGAPPR